MTIPGIGQAYKDRAVELIQAERERQEEKFPQDRDLNPMVWLTVLMEEVGEVAKEVLERNPDLMEEELIQVAAVAQGWLEDYLIQKGRNDIRLR